MKIDSLEVKYDTDDPRARSWFYPRYAGGRVHEPALTYRLLDEVREASCFVDVGAFIGFHTCLAAKASRGVVHAFEMDRHNVRLLHKNIALNGLDNVIVYQCAVGDRRGRGAYMRGADDYGAGHRLMRRDDRPWYRRMISRVVRQRSTDVVALDDVLDVDPDVVKVDVEGAELMVLHGMQEILRADPRLFIELHPPASQTLYGYGPDAVIALLQAAGFETFEIGDFRRDEQSLLRPLEVPSGLTENSLLFAFKTPIGRI